MAKGIVISLNLLDLSAAFDSIVHTILFDRLHTFYKINELPLGLFKSYLSVRTHSTKVSSTLSHPADLLFGVPESSVLGPILFSLHKNSISSIIQSYTSIKYHFYIDDTQLYAYHSHQPISLTLYKNSGNAAMTFKISCSQIN